MKRTVRRWIRGKSPETIFYYLRLILPSLIFVQLIFHLSFFSILLLKSFKVKANRIQWGKKIYLKLRKNYAISVMI